MGDQLRPWTLCIDIGGTNIKAAVLDASGVVRTPFVREPTPRPAVPEAVLGGLVKLSSGQRADRISLGFPGVVVDGVTKTAPNLDAGWGGCRLAAQLEATTGMPTRVANDADLHGLAVIEGDGVEMLLALGTGLGSALYQNGQLVPNLELGHHPFGDGQTYEQRVSNARLAELGTDAWRLRVIQMLDQIRPIWNFRRLYLGGGNARLLEPAAMPPDVSIADNRAGVLGGVKLWEARNARY